MLEHDDELGQDLVDPGISDLDFDDDIEDLEAARDKQSDHRTTMGSASLQSPSDTLTATQADLALLEAAMSSAVHHPNVVQTYHYRILHPRKEGAGEFCSSGQVTRVSETCCTASFKWIFPPTLMPSGLELPDLVS